MPQPSQKVRITTLERENVALKMRVFRLEQLMQEIIDADVVTRAEVNAAFEELGRRVEHHIEFGLSEARTITVPRGAYLDKP